MCVVFPPPLIHKLVKHIIVTKKRNNIKMIFDFKRKQLREVTITSQHVLDTGVPINYNAYIVRVYIYVPTTFRSHHQPVRFQKN